MNNYINPHDGNQYSYPDTHYIRKFIEDSFIELDNLDSVFRRRCAEKYLLLFLSHNLHEKLKKDFGEQNIDICYFTLQKRWSHIICDILGIKTSKPFYIIASVKYNKILNLYANVICSYKNNKLVHDCFYNTRNMIDFTW